MRFVVKIIAVISVVKPFWCEEDFKKPLDQTKSAKIKILYVRKLNQYLVDIIIGVIKCTFRKRHTHQHEIHAIQLYIYMPKRN